jgi:long-chain fatty acid transport protein
MKLRVVAAALAVMGIALPGAALATDGYFAHGYGMKALGRGGAAIAMTDDSYGGANNPASMVWAGNRFDIGVQWFRPDREASRVGSAGGTGLFDGSANGNEDQNFFIPEVGFNYLVNPNLALGVSVYGNGGMNTKYPAGQLDPGLCMGGAPTGVRSANLLCGQGDLGVDLSQLIVAPTLSWKFHPQHSIGIAPLFAYQRFEAYGLQPFAAISAAPQYVTNNGHDTSTGWGVRIGWSGLVAPTLRLGATFQSKISMSKFNSYSGLFAEQGSFDIPMNWGVGAAWQATPNLLLTADYERIYYSQVNSVGNSSRVPGCMPTGPMGPGAGAACLGASADSIGFGWSDISVFKLGAEYRINSSWLVRAGYNDSQNPIGSQDVTFNILAPGVVQNHLTLGFTWTLPGGSELTGMYFHAFNNSVSGPANNPYFPVGGTETISLSEDGLGVAWGLKF